MSKDLSMTDVSKSVQKFGESLKKSREFDTAKRQNESSEKAAIKALEFIGVSVSKSKSMILGGAPQIVCDLNPAKGISAGTAYKIALRYRKLFKEHGVKHINWKKNVEKGVYALLERGYRGSAHKELLEEKKWENMPALMKKLYTSVKENDSLKPVFKAIEIYPRAYIHIHNACSYLRELRSKDNQKAQKSKTNRKAKTISEKQSNIVQVNMPVMVEKCRKILTDKKPVNMQTVLALAVVTGRRPTELIKTGSMKKVNKNTVFFSGQLKMKTRKERNEKDSYNIPVFLPPELVISSLKRIQNHYKDEDITFLNILGEKQPATVGDKRLKDSVEHNTGVSQRFASARADAAARFFAIPGLEFRLSRVIYANAACETFRPKGVSVSKYRAQILGQGSDLSAQINYDQANITTDTGGKAIISFQEAQDVNTSLLAKLKKATGEIMANKRARGMHRLHEYLISQVTEGYIHKEDEMTAGYLRSLVLEGKKVNKKTVDKYFEMTGINSQP